MPRRERPGSGRRVGADDRWPVEGLAQEHVEEVHLEDLGRPPTGLLDELGGLPIHNPREGVGLGLAGRDARASGDLGERRAGALG
eukprot:8269412-Alexandrium_andersonii.AAC.1